MYSVFKGCSRELSSWESPPSYTGMKEVQDITGVSSVKRRVSEEGYLISEIDYDKIQGIYVGNIYKPGTMNVLRSIISKTFENCKFKVDLYLRDVGYIFKWN